MKIINKPSTFDLQKNEPNLTQLVPDDGLLLKHLDQNIIHSRSFLLNIPVEKLSYRYLPGKWTIPEIVVHLIDMERIYMYRALRFARNDKTVLPGFDDISYILYSGANERSMFSLVAEMEAVRLASIQLLDGLPDEAMFKTGITNGYRVSVGALAYHIAGHELHHIKLIRERYLN